MHSKAIITSVPLLGLGETVKRAPPVLAMCILLLLIPASFASGYIDLTVAESKDFVDCNLSSVILDVRTQDEYLSGHIRNAKHIPVAELEGRLGELNTTSKILVYCSLGGRSATASQILVNNGFLHVYNMLGGVTAWIDAGYPVYIRYPSIQGAINETHMGETVFVSQGLYYEHLTISKPLKLVGESPETTIIDGEDLGTLIRVEADGVLVTGFMLRKCGCPCGGNSGVYIEDGHRDVNVSHNLITQNGGYGISVEGGINMSFADNTLTNNSYGVRISNSSYVAVSDNIFSNNTSFGLYMSFSDDGVFCGNDFSDNVYSVGFFYSSNNTFYHNNMLNSAEHVFTQNSLSTWDNGCEGNYWSNYDGTDLDGDGVGDTDIPWEGVDDYPLMTIYWNPGDIDHDMDVDIFDVVRAASAYGSTPSDPNWNPHCDTAQPYGVISIYDIVTIASNYGKKCNR